MRDLSDLTMARHEIAVLEAIAKLKRATVAALGKEAGVTGNAVRWALDRQKGISVKKIRHGIWEYLPEPGDQPLPELTARQKLDFLFEDWIVAQGIQHDGLIFGERNRSYLKWLRFDEIQPGHVLTCGKAYMVVSRIEVVDGYYRIWGKGKSKTPTFGGQADDLLLARFTPDKTLYL